MLKSWTHISRRYSIRHIKSAIPPKIKSTSTTSHVPNLAKYVTDPEEANLELRLNLHQAPSSAEIAKSQAFFNLAKIKLKWTLASYQEILEKESKILPEVLLLGPTNSGKSTLINLLLLNKTENKSMGSSTEHAFVSRREGFTKTLNCFEIGGSLNLIDSPGYGMFGTEKQGEFVLDFIRSRKNLRRVYILIDSTLKEPEEEDKMMIEFLVSEGIAFEIILTKADKLYTKFMPRQSKFKNPKDLQATIEAIEKGNQRLIGMLSHKVELFEQLPMGPRVILNNAVTNTFLRKRYGYKEIRWSILHSCGLMH